MDKKRKYITKDGGILRIDENGNETLIRASDKMRKSGLVKPPKDKKKNASLMAQYRIDTAHKKRKVKKKSSLTIKSRKSKK